MQHYRVDKPWEKQLPQPSTDRSAGEGSAHRLRVSPRHLFSSRPLGFSSQASSSLPSTSPSSGALLSRALFLRLLLLLYRPLTLRGPISARYWPPDISRTVWSSL